MDSLITRREKVNGRIRYYKKYTCQFCGKEFEGRADIKRIYCSRECHNKAMTKEGEIINRNHIYHLECKVCGKEFIAYNPEQPYCSHKCSGIAHRGSANSHYKNGTYDHFGYIKELKVNGGYRFTHRGVVEDRIGRKLSSKEHIHHINGDTKDNRIENLIILTCSEHMRIHQYLKGNGKMTEAEYQAIINEGKERIRVGK